MTDPDIEGCIYPPYAPPVWSDYELIDSGGGKKLERYGKYRLVRPDPQAIWAPFLPPSSWQADAVFVRHGQEGRWEMKRPLPPHWTVSFQELVFKVKPTSFKHTGLFPEQATNWLWLRELIRERPGANVLNLFAYTGGATMAALAAGGSVCHVDASKAALSWARENQELSGLSGQPVRYIHDDVMAFVRREVRRGKRYDAVVMDPPPYGRGAGGEMWRIEQDLAPLMESCLELLGDSPLFFLINSYASGYSHLSMRNFLQDFTGRFGGALDSGNLILPHTSSPRLLPCGIFARWRSGPVPA